MRFKYGKWYARWHDETGRSLMKSFPTVHEARKYQETIRAEVRARKLQGIGSVGQETARWLAGLGKGTPRDHWHERVVARDMIEVADRQKVADLDFLIPNSLLDRWKRKYSLAALYNLRFRLKSLCRWLELRGAKSLVENLPRTPTPQARQVLIDSGDLENMKKVSPPWFRCFLLLCFDGGLRRGEALRVAPMHYSVGSGKITIEVKKRRIQSFQVTDELREILALAAASTDHSIPFIESLRGRPVTRSTIELWFAKIKKKAGAPPKINTHDLRRTAATEIYLQTKSISACQAFLGHANPITTLRYIVHADNLLLKPIVEKMKIAFRKGMVSGSIATEPQVTHVRVEKVPAPTMEAANTDAVVLRVLRELDRNRSQCGECANYFDRIFASSDAFKEGLVLHSMAHAMSHGHSQESAPGEVA